MNFKNNQTKRKIWIKLENRKMEKDLKIDYTSMKFLNSYKSSLQLILKRQ